MVGFQHKMRTHVFIDSKKPALCVLLNVSYAVYFKRCGLYFLYIYHMSEQTSSKF